MSVVHVPPSVERVSHTSGSYSGRTYATMSPPTQHTAGFPMSQRAPTRWALGGCSRRGPPRISVAETSSPHPFGY